MEIAANAFIILCFPGTFNSIFFINSFWTYRSNVVFNLLYFGFFALIFAFLEKPNVIYGRLIDSIKSSVFV